ncbi:hypothetical protein KC19_11G085200 [Ceratodon purpureus]|uniref:Uncharacterized protein n=1 Tax=Ceratodon purpureus TaxID=3225 RepID=A0A8T0GED9_CERPU|nr:hypothetical protein KC19_11G085200 [Ceratodon purpureus]
MRSCEVEFYLPPCRLKFFTSLRFTNFFHQAIFLSLQQHPGLCRLQGHHCLRHNRHRHAPPAAKLSSVCPVIMPKIGVRHVMMELEKYK